MKQSTMMKNLKYKTSKHTQSLPLEDIPRVVWVADYNHANAKSLFSMQ